LVDEQEEGGEEASSKDECYIAGRTVLKPSREGDCGLVMGV